MLERLLEVIQHSHFHIRTRYSYRFNTNGTVAAKVLEQIFFCNTDQIQYARRFASGFMQETDATFNTNALGLLLSYFTGITNTNLTFPFGYSLVRSESEEAMLFSFSCVRLLFPQLVLYPLANKLQLDEFFWCAAPPPEVTTADGAVGTHAAITRHHYPSLPRNNGFMVHQICEWHAAKAIQARLTAVGRYAKEEREKIMDGVWRWIKSSTPAILTETRPELLLSVKEQEREYLHKNWVTSQKERRLIRCYTQYLPNLGAKSTQRHESYNEILHGFLNPRFTLPEAVAKLTNWNRQVMHEISSAENASRIASLSTHLYDRPAFQALERKITHFALKLLAPEWEKAKSLYRTGIMSSPTGCDCSLPFTHKLPCRHWFFRIARIREMLPHRHIIIPLSLIHPRWLVDGPPAVALSWAMSDGLDCYGAPSVENSIGGQTSEHVINLPLPERYPNRGADMLMEAAIDNSTFHEELSAEDKELFAAASVEQSKKLRDHFAEDKALPMEFHPPPASRKHWLVQKKSKDRSTARSLTSLEIAERKERKTEKKTRTAKNSCKVLPQKQNDPLTSSYKRTLRSTGPVGGENPIPRGTRAQKRTLDMRTLEEEMMDLVTQAEVAVHQAL